MTSTTRVGAGRILFVVNLAMTIGADATRELSATPAAVKSGDKLVDWLTITAVPLGVFLMGACIWSCIKNSVCWRSFLELILCDRREVSIAPEAAAGLPSSPSQHGSDLEEGNAASHLGIGDDSAILTRTGEVMQQPALQSADNDEILPALLM